VSTANTIKREPLLWTSAEVHPSEPLTDIHCLFPYRLKYKGTVGQSSTPTVVILVSGAEVVCEIVASLRTTDFIHPPK